MKKIWQKGYKVKKMDPEFLVRACITAALLIFCFVIILLKDPEDSTQWAYSAIAFIMGYWLKQ